MRGNFTADWVRNDKDQWRVRRLATGPASRAHGPSREARLLHTLAEFIINFSAFQRVPDADIRSRIMTLRMRFLITDPGEVDLDELARSLRSTNRRYQCAFEDGAGTISYGGDEIAGVEVYNPGDGTFDDQLAELEEAASEGSGAGEARVADALATVQLIFSAELLGKSSKQDDSREAMQPVWEWFFGNRTGLLQVDSEGYFDEEGLIFEVE